MHACKYIRTYVCTMYVRVYALQTYNMYKVGREGGREEGRQGGREGWGEGRRERSKRKVPFI
jgi:hypothetical protein